MEGNKLPVLTYSMIRSYDCPKKFYYRHIKHLVPVVMPEALSIGRLYHGGREHGEEWALEEIRKGKVLSQDQADAQAKTEALILGMLRGARLAFRDIEVEREPEWCHPIVNPDTGRRSRRYLSAGKADGITTANGHATIIEEKTKGSSITESDVTKLSQDMQVLNEVANLQRARDVVIDRVYYRYIRKPTIRQRQNESVQEFCKRLEDDYQARPEFYFTEIEIVVDQERVTAWERDLWLIAHIIGYSHAHKLWYRNTSRCAEWGGCVYLPLCTGEDAAHMFTTEEPNPELSRSENG